MVVSPGDVDGMKPGRTKEARTAPLLSLSLGVLEVTDWVPGGALKLAGSG